MIPQKADGETRLRLRDFRKWGQRTDDYLDTCHTGNRKKAVTGKDVLLSHVRRGCLVLCVCARIVVSALVSPSRHMYRVMVLLYYSTMFTE